MDEAMRAPNTAFLIIARLVAGILGGYALTSAFVALSGLVFVHLGMSPGESTVLASMLGFLVYLLLVMWAFAIRSVTRLWVLTAIWLFVMSVLIFALRLTP